MARSTRKKQRGGDPDADPFDNNELIELVELINRGDDDAALRQARIAAREAEKDLDWD